MPPESVSFCGVIFAADAQVVDLFNVTPPDLRPLAALTRLRELRIVQTNPHQTPVGLPLELDPLAKLDRLEVVALPKLPVRDLTPLSHLPRLRELDLRGTRVDDVAPLGGAASLRALRLGGTPLRTIDPLRALTELTILDVSHT